MSTTTPRPGTIGWIDIAVDDAVSLRDFYAAVVGWRAEGCDMGGYEDFNMIPGPDGSPVAGICHARGSNAGLPGAWMIYIVVADLDASLEAAKARGGEVIHGPRGNDQYGRSAVIRDPAGAVCALWQAGTS